LIAIQNVALFYLPFIWSKDLLAFHCKHISESIDGQDDWDTAIIFNRLDTASIIYLNVP